jgi:hypothetical protein
MFQRLIIDSSVPDDLQADRPSSDHADALLRTRAIAMAPDFSGTDWRSRRHSCMRAPEW